jgi:hypothetical protein
MCIFLFCNVCGYVGFIQIMVTKCVFLFVLKICNLVIYFSENEKDWGENFIEYIFFYLFISIYYLN